MVGLLGAVPGYVWVALLVAVLARSFVRTLRRRRAALDSRDDVEYNEALRVLCEGSARRNFNPFHDIDWNSPEMAVSDDDPRWIADDSLSRHPWFQAQPLDKQIEMSVWRRTNIAKISYQFESALNLGLYQYTFVAQEHSLEHRYCLHECAEEANHILMFRELMVRLGRQVPGFPRWLRRAATMFPFYAQWIPAMFFFGVLAIETPVDYMQRELLRKDLPNTHPLMTKIMAIHVAEEARHISFADLWLERYISGMTRRWRFALSLYVPFIMRSVGRSILSLNRDFFKEFGVPYSVRHDLRLHSRESRDEFAAMFVDIRALCYATGMMNPVARLTWHLFRISGERARYRGEPMRALTPTNS
ncbi:MAG: diiron oxygenase [Spirochaetes bacterium]|nr:MAG: diiron oxygenase [Spirochaetota bacterium]